MFAKHQLRPIDKELKSATSRAEDVVGNRIKKISSFLYTIFVHDFKSCTKIVYKFLPDFSQAKNIPANNTGEVEENY